MPNWCYNRINVFGNENEEKLKEVHEIFATERPFNEIYPVPDFKTIPNSKGELPKLEQMKNPDGSILWETYNFPDGKNDDRWYHWCVDNWGTKWEPDMHGNEMSDYDSLEITFNTAWSPPEGVVEKLREKFPELSFQCFYDEPGCEIAGYYQDSLITGTFIPPFWGMILYNCIIQTNLKIMLPNVQRISNRILEVDNFENVAYVCCDWEEFVFEVAEWGVDHIAQVDFDDLSEDDVKALDEFIASFGCSPEKPHPCSKYADPIFA